MAKNLENIQLSDPIFLNAKRPSPRNFIKKLTKSIEKDRRKNPYAYVGMIIYPINGRAQGITPIGHYSTKRSQIIKEIADELRENEPQFAEAGLKLLETEDRVRIGRIVVEILKYPRDINTEGTAIFAEDQ